MFDKSEEVGGPGTVVGSNVKLNGIIKDSNDITIHGIVDGEVISEKNVLVTETASIKGPVSAQIITISGKVTGTITAQQKLEITPTGKVYGNIATKDLVIRSGAIFVGKSATLGSDKNNTSEPKKIETTEKPEAKKVEPEVSKSIPVKEPEPQVDEKKSTGGFWSKLTQDDPKEKNDDKNKPSYELEK